MANYCERIPQDQECSIMKQSAQVTFRFTSLFDYLSLWLRHILHFDVPARHCRIASSCLGEVHPRRYRRNAVRIDDEEHVPPGRCEVSAAGHRRTQRCCIARHNREIDEPLFAIE